MAKTHHRRRHRRANRTRRGGVKNALSASDKEAKKWAKSILSPTGKAGIAKSKSYAKPKSEPGDTSRQAHGQSRVGK